MDYTEKSDSSDSEDDTAIAGDDRSEETSAAATPTSLPITNNDELVSLTPPVPAVPKTFVPDTDDTSVVSTLENGHVQEIIESPATTTVAPTLENGHVQETIE